MKVILKQDIKGLGKKGDIVDTSDGYARNYLIPRGMVVEATQGNITKAKEQKKAQEIREQRERQEAQALAEKISQATLLLKAKAAEDGRLYGSVTSKDISQALEEQKNKGRQEEDQPSRAHSIYRRSRWRLRYSWDYW